MTLLPAPPPVFHLLPPGAELVDRALGAAAHAPLSYAPVGGTEGPLPAGWDHDDQARVVGRGDAAWDAAREAVRRWVPFSMPWVRVHDPALPLAEGAHVAFTSHQLGLWTLNVCRVVAVWDGPTRFGFAYGTLDGHVVAGEERFLAARDPATGEVSFGIRKFSRPNHVLVRLAGPVARRLQRQFTADALDAVARFVEGR